MTTPTYADPTLSAPTGAPRTVLDGLRVDVIAKLQHDTYRLPVPLRPGYFVRFKRFAPYEAMVAASLAAVDKSMPLGANEKTLWVHVILELAVGIEGEDEAPGGENGEALTFKSKDLQAILGADTPAMAVARLYGADGDIRKAWERISREARWGLGEDGEPQDPTRPSETPTSRTAD